MPGEQFSAGVLRAIWLSVMPTVEMTQHLYRFFPQLENRKITVAAGSVAEVLKAINEIAPGFTDYILDEHGALRRHVNLSINDAIVIDRKTLSDRVQDDATVYIFQALSGG
jgi:molybdopterin synthase sulfur carrier subunit